MLHLKHTILIWFALISLSASGLCQQQATHGTVNIVLANSAGAVVVADSRLSNMTGTVGEGAKLFQLDQQTVCVIAGFYSDPGPRTPAGYYPFDVTIPYLMGLYSSQTANTSNPSLDAKFQTMIRLLQFYLSFVAAADKAQSGANSSPSVSQLTLVGYENGKLTIVSVDLEPAIKEGRIQYILTNQQKISPLKDLVWHLGGIDQISFDILYHPEIQAKSNNAILQMFGTSYLRDKGASLTIQDMSKLARLIKDKTSNAHPKEVGGLTQFASLSNGRVDQFDQPLQQSAKFPVRSFIRIGNMTTSQTQNAIKIDPPLMVLLEGGQIDGGFFKLDDIVVINTLFKNCTLVFDGSTKSLFAPTNRLVNVSFEVTKPEYLQ